MAKGKILVVDDEEHILELIRYNLDASGYEVIEASDGDDAVKKAINEVPDLILLDLMLPGKDGYDVCRELRSNGKTKAVPIIMLTAKSQDLDKIMGLEYGADDYIIKPFNPMELLLRIKALLRRISDYEEKKGIIQGKFKLDIYAKRIFKNNKEIDLTPKEYSIIKLFIENPNKAFSRDELMDLIWGENYIADPKIVDVNIRRLRSKIECSSLNEKFIETIWGFGYRWRDD